MTTATKRECTVDGCTDPVKYGGPGWCAKHYQRYRAHGTLTLPAKVVDRPALKRGHPLEGDNVRPIITPNHVPGRLCVTCEKMHRREINRRRRERQKAARANDRN
jgi:hypothetical protein